MKIKFLSPTKFELANEKHAIISDQPKAAGGTDEGMNPVDIFVSSLGACIAVFISHLLVRRSVDLSRCGIELNYAMADGPRRVKSINIELDLPGDLTDKDKKALLKSAQLCTIHNTLHNPPEMKIEIK